MITRYEITAQQGDPRLATLDEARLSLVPLRMQYGNSFCKSMRRAI
jgi:hypothetical protein